MSQMQHSAKRIFFLSTVLFVCAIAMGQDTVTDSTLPLATTPVINSAPDTIRASIPVKKKIIPILKEQSGISDSIKPLFFDSLNHTEQRYNLNAFQQKYTSKKFRQASIYATSNPIVSKPPKVNIQDIKPLPSEKSIPFNNAFILLLFAILFLLIIIRLKYVKYISLIFVAIFNKHEAYRLFREHNPTIDSIYRFLATIFIFSSTFLLYFHFISIEFFQNAQYITNLAICFSIIVSYLLFNSFIHRAFGFVFDRSSEFKEFIHHKSLYNKMIGLVLLPIIIVIGLSSKHNTQIFTQISIILTLLLSTIGLIKGSLTILTKRVSLRHWLLYVLCIEILPLIISYKILRTIL
jgi:hypothetical protein